MSKFTARSKLLGGIHIIVIRFVFLTAFLTLLPALAHQTALARAPLHAPPPAAKADILGDLQKDLAQSEQEKELLESDLEALAQELKQSKDKQIALARRIQSTEQRLKTLEDDISHNQAEKDKLSKELEDDKYSITQLVLALNKLEQVPLIALAMRPNAPLETAQTAMMMEDLGVTLADKTKDLRRKSERLDRVILSLDQDKRAVKTKLSALGQDRLDLDRYLKKNQQFYKRSRSDLTAKEQSIQAMSMAAQDLQDLMARLKKEEELSRKRAEEEKRKARSILSFLAPKPKLEKPASSNSNLPVLGAVKIAYGQKDHLDAPSKGWWIEGRKHGLVVSPFAGHVRFVGAFKQYGNIMIIEHSGKYHSLLAGFDEIHAQIDQPIEAGEAVGRLKASNNSGGAPMLYYELRKSGKAIDPVRKFGKL